MRSWRVEEFGEPAEQWRLLEDFPECTPGSGEIKVAVEACGLGLPDVFMCRNNYPLTPPLPFTPSQEAAGEVVAVGDSVDPALIGKRVLGTTLFLKQAGGLADYCLMSASGATPIPDEMPGEVAAGFFIPYMTAWVGLVRRGKLTAEDTLLVVGASGSSGTAAVKLGKAIGARVIAVAGGPEKAAFCQSIGADHVIDHRAENITESTMNFTQGGGASVVFDPVGGKAGRAAFKATAFEGRFVVIGYASGEWARISLPETLPKNISLIGAMPVGFSDDVMRQGVQELIAHWQRGNIALSAQQVFEFDDALSAIAHIAGGKVEGKVVVKVKA